MTTREGGDRWAEEPFLRAACDAMTADLDWDSLDSGRLHRATSSAKTLGGAPVVVGVLDKAERLEDFFRDAEEEMRDGALPLSTTIWLYVPNGLQLPCDLPKSVVVKTIPTGVE